MIGLKLRKVNIAYRAGCHLVTFDGVQPDQRSTRTA